MLVFFTKQHQGQVAPGLMRTRRMNMHMRSLRRIWLIGLVGWCLLCGTYARCQSDEVAPGENLVVQGVPKIPAAIAEQVGRYTEYRQAGFRSWNPVRREMLIITRFGDTY